MKYQASLAGLEVTQWDNKGVASTYTGYLSNLRAVLSRGETNWGYWHCEFFNPRGNSVGSVGTTGLHACYHLAVEVARELSGKRTC